MGLKWQVFKYTALHYVNEVGRGKPLIRVLQPRLFLVGVHNVCIYMRLNRHNHT